MAKTLQTPARSRLNAVDPTWSQVRSEAEEAVGKEPALGGFIFATILNHDRLEDAVAHRIAQRLQHADVDATLLYQTFQAGMVAEPDIGAALRADLHAVYERDPACHRLIEPLLYFKGFHALASHRFAHQLWQQGRKDLAYYLQSQASRVFAVDIHPAARLGRGIMLDHGTGFVVGETAAIGDNCSILHGVTLGGSGKDEGDRHPKIGNHVLLGAGAKVLGNIRVGNCSRVAAGSVVLRDVPDDTTVAGVPAKEVGPAGCKEPARAMDQMLDAETLEG
jgi:serine O-acetyltransferase